VQGQAELLQVVDALGATGRLAGRLHGRQEQGDQHADDGDDHQQLDQRETASNLPHSLHGRTSADVRRGRKEEDQGGTTMRPGEDESVRRRARPRD